MFRFTIRELVFVTVIVAIVAAWWIDRTRLTRRWQDAQTDRAHDRWAVEVLMRAIRYAGNDQIAAERTNPTSVTVRWHTSESYGGSHTYSYPRIPGPAVFGKQ